MKFSIKAIIKSSLKFIILLNILLCGVVFAVSVPDKTIPQAQAFNVPAAPYCTGGGCNNLNIEIPVGIVAEVSGTVERTNTTSGIPQQINVGDPVYSGEVIVTGPGAHLCFNTTPVGTKKCLGPNEKYTA